MNNSSATDAHGLTAGFGMTNRGVFGVLVRATHDSTEVVNFATVKFPAGAIENDVIVDASRIGATIRSVARDLGVNDRAISLAAISTEYAMRSVRLPDVPPSERRTLVRGELEQLEALPEGAGAFDMLWIQAPIEDGRQRADATACYSTDAHIERLKTSVKHSSFRLELLEPASVALVRALVGATASPPRAAAFLNLSGSHSDLCIHDGSSIRHLRRIPAGTKDLIEAIQPKPALNPGPGGLVGSTSLMGGSQEGHTEAPRPLWSSGEQPAPGQTLSGVPSGELHSGAGKMGAATTASFFVSEIQRTLAFFAREFPEAPQPDQLMIVGGAGPSRALQTLLQKILTVRVTTEIPLLPPGSAIDLTQSDEVEAYLAAIGVAVGRMGIDRGVPRLNIAQQEARVTMRRSAPNLLRTGVMVGGACLAAAVVLALVITTLNVSANRDLTAVGAQIAALNAERAPLVFNDQVAAAAQAARLKAQIPASSVLGRVAAAEQPGVAVTGLHVTSEGKVTLEGDAADTASMQRFAYTAGQGSSIIAPTFEMMHQDERGQLTFRLVGKAPGGQGAAPDSRFK